MYVMQTKLYPKGAWFDTKRLLSSMKSSAVCSLHKVLEKCFRYLKPSCPQVPSSMFLDFLDMFDISYGSVLEMGYIGMPPIWENVAIIKGE